MTITIPNADNSLIKIIETLNEKLLIPYEIISDNKIPNKETTKAIEMCGKGFSKTYKDFGTYIQEVKNNA